MSEPHSHEHEHYSSASRGALITTLGIVFVLMIAEIVGGLLSNSLALVSDAFHMLVDALALGLSLFALNLARRPSTLTRTFGYHRVEIMAALANGSILVLVSAFIFYEAIQRFQQPPEVRTPLMLGIAVLGLVGNLAGIALLSRGSKTSLNIKGAFWHVLGDTISSVGVIAAAIIIMLTGWTAADPIMAIVISVIVLWGAVRLVRDSVDILMEAVPKHIKVETVVDKMRGIPGVQEIHDIHIWTITSGIIALSAHLMIEDQMVSISNDIRDSVNHMLGEDFGITHTTLQLECSRCQACPVGVVCQIGRADHD
jgi:cobalt-zinc-cadmium efflux system protein